MKYLLVIILLTGLIFSQSGENQSFKLQDGTIIVGLVIEETETTFIIQTKYGSVTLNKDELVRTEYEIKLKTGETFSGIKLSETDLVIKLATKLGVLDIEKSDILDMKESGQVTETGEKKSAKTTSYQRSYSLFDVLFGTTSGSSAKDIEFALGEERLIDTFFDPTAYVLDEGTLYLSGLSFAFGLSDKLQISSRWVDYFWGNFNIRPKYMLFHKGNWEQESALAVGGHFHTYWRPNKVVWQDGTVDVCDDNSNYDGNDCNTTPKNYGGFFPIGATVEGTTDYYNDKVLDVNETEDLSYMFEFFTAYTFSKARKGMKGRISSTVGALFQAPTNGEWPYRIFGSLDLDITSQLKMVGEVFYDPFFIDLIQRNDLENEGPFFASHAMYEVSDTEVTKADFKSNRPIHFDFGFMYAVNENFRFGIHSQTPIIAFYWKL
jgi:hypothetical protein